jgi:hypothetical protein
MMDEDNQAGYTTPPPSDPPQQVPGAPQQPPQPMQPQFPGGTGPSMTDINRADIHALIGRVIDAETGVSNLAQRVQALERANEVLALEIHRMNGNNN